MDELDRGEEVDEVPDATTQADAMPALLGWRSVLPAFVLGVLSMLSFTDGGVEISGGAALAALAALVLVWPILRQIGVRGGSIEVLGLKAQVAELEQRTEADLALTVEELRADLEDLRDRMTTAPASASAPEPEPEPDDGVAVDVFREVVGQYRSHPETGEWRHRVNADRVLLSNSVRVPVARLREFVDASPDDRETKMAAAVALGAPSHGEGEAERVELLERLLRDRSQRVVHRAARSTLRIAERGELDSASRERLGDAIVLTMQRRLAAGVEGALKDAMSALRLRPTRRQG